MLETPSILLDYSRGCKLLADVLIAVDSIGYRNFATQNYRESQVLTTVLDSDAIIYRTTQSTASRFSTTPPMPRSLPDFDLPAESAAVG